jgi:predicted amidophosphoribosyltransferase
VLDLLLPQRCLVCSLPGEHVCGGCRSALRRIGPPICERCGAPTAWPVRRCAECSGRRLAFARARAAVEYDEPVRKIVAAWKERGLRRLACWAAQIVVDTVARPDVAAVAYVPGGLDRRLKRGHHAAERLARELAAAWDLPLEQAALRTRGAPHQRGLPRAARHRNIAGAFSPGTRVPARVALVDDVYTTVATVNAASSALRKGGARRVEVVTFARAIRIS